ncbi:hypothetical protein BS47DRAFT_592934 [Hydnum rufescens UP504]|uniref:Uncharacterized protein n=1 Tax=Hydnum rufescens UP504 TaxID=1448309 RepID=A0A9P6B4X2_9AGAM|nr:hypothetical protein BS47DRAFT_592934 [Hydnum rufescens UP504]
MRSRLRISRTFRWMWILARPHGCVGTGFTTYFLSGTTPDTLIDGGKFSLPCILRHEYNTLHTFMALLISPAPFISFSLPNLTVYPGIKFNVSYARFIRPGADPTAFAVTLSRPLDWLHSNPESLEFYGLPPSTATTGETLVNAIHDNGTDISSHATFLLAIDDSHRSAFPQSSSTIWSPQMHRGLIAAIVLLPLLLAIITSLVIKRYTRSFRRRLFVAHARGRSRRKSIEVEGFDFEKGGSVRAIIRPRIDAPQSARVISATWKDSMPRTSVDISNQVQRVRLVTVPASGSPPELLPVYDQTTPTSSKYRPAETPSIVVGMADPPSMSFTTYFRSPQTPGLLQSEGEPDYLTNLDVHQTSPHSSTRSVNSAYDSLPSWDSESTWARDRRRRPPSPAWRRGDLQPRVDGTAFFDYLEEKGETSGFP